MRERILEQSIGEPGIPRQERPVQVRAVDTTHASAFEARLAVVPEAGDHASKGLDAGAEVGTARMVLEAGECVTCPGAVEKHVADQAPLASHGVEREQANTGQLRAV